MRSMHKVLLLVGMVCGGWVHAQIRGAGATFPSAVYQAWGQEYERTTSKKVLYNPTGSGDGQKKVIAREVDFGGSDIATEMAMSGELQKLLEDKLGAPQHAV